MMNAQDRQKILNAIAETDIGQADLMEVCGTHTMSIAKSGLKSMLPAGIKLISGPGCPVCVTPEETIDAVLDLSMERDVVIATYGDLIRVPGSRQGDNLSSRRAQGAQVEVVYSAIDAVALAASRPGKQVVFLGAGFETTAPGTAAAVKTAAEKRIKNFSVFSMLKKVEPALRALIEEPGFQVKGFICPGHVATIIGEKGFRFLAEEYGMPSVISGFEPDDILVSVYRLIKQIDAQKAKLENEYTRAVRPEGNPAAMMVMNEILEPKDDLWRGLGSIPLSGFGIIKEYSEYDAEARFSIEIRPSGKESICRCGDVIRGKISPVKCPLFGGACTPEDPVGPCMVSSEGACAAEYKYMH